MIGKDIRLKRLFKHSARTFILPMDHGVTIGPQDGLKDIIQVIAKISNNIDAVIVHKGLVRQIIRCLVPDGVDLIVHLSASTTLSPNPNGKELVTSVEHAIKLGATAVSVHVNLGGETEPAMLKDLGNTAELCDTWGIPLLAMMYVRDGSKESEYDQMKIMHAARIAEEMGADIVKVNYTGTPESFADVVKSVKIPVVVAGGPKMSSDPEFLTMIYDAVKAGARGVAVGRNIFQNSNPLIISDEIAKIIH